LSLSKVNSPITAYIVILLFTLNKFYFLGRSTNIASAIFRGFIVVPFFLKISEPVLSVSRRHTYAESVFFLHLCSKGYLALLVRENRTLYRMIVFFLSLPRALRRFQHSAFHRAHAFFSPRRFQFLTRDVSGGERERERGMYSRNVKRDYRISGEMTPFRNDTNVYIYVHAAFSV